MVDGIRIDALDPVPLSRGSIIPVMKDGVTSRGTVEEILELIEMGDLPDISSLFATPFVDVASGATVDLGAAASTSVNITGTTGPITSFGISAPEGGEYLLKMNGAVTITHGANLICPEELDIVTYSGMLLWVKREAGSAWRVIWYTSRVRVAGGGAHRIIFNGASLTGNITITLPNGPVTIPTGTLITGANVAANVAAVAAGAVGSYMLGAPQNGVAHALGDTIAGSSLRSANSGSATGGTQSGTWRCMGVSATSAVSTLWLRIS